MNLTYTWEEKWKKMRIKTLGESIPKQLKCPICKNTTEKDKNKNPFLPFCSERCRTIDLGKWLDDKYVITGDEPIQDSEQ